MPSGRHQLVVHDALVEGTHEHAHHETHDAMTIGSCIKESMSLKAHKWELGTNRQRM